MFLVFCENEENVDSCHKNLIAVFSSKSENYSKSENDDLSSTIDKADQETVKATITWPIIKGGENASAIKKYSLEKQRAQLILKDTSNKVLIDTSNSWSKSAIKISLFYCIAYFKKDKI